MKLKQPLRPRHLKAAIPYVQISRFEHWFKNLLILPGVALVVRSQDPAWDWGAIMSEVGTALIPICLVSSGNYVINEIMDAPYDALHPHKCRRPVASGRACARWAWFLAFFYYGAGLAVAYGRFNADFFLCLLLFLLIGGIAYNIPPLRWKEIAFLDVTTESSNNPIRFLLGWHAFTIEPFPSWILLISYWAFGAFLMSAKRLSELRHLENPAIAALYRRSFRFYSEARLLFLTISSALVSLILLGIVLVQYRVSLFPIILLGILFVFWAILLIYKNGAFPREPEKIWKEPLFLIYVIFAGLLILRLTMRRF